MTVLADLVGDLSWGLRAAWMAWGIWIVFQLVWFRRARVEAPSIDVSYDGMGGRSPLSIAVRPERVRAPKPPFASGVADANVSIPEPPPAPVMSAASAPELPLALSEAMPAVADTAETSAEQLTDPAPQRGKRRRRSPRGETASVMSAEAV